MQLTRRNGDDVRERQEDGHTATVRQLASLAGAAGGSKLPVRVVSPHVDAARRGEGHRMRATGTDARCDGDDVGQSGDSDGRALLRR